MIHRDHRARESELKLSDYRGRNAPSFSPHHLGINKRRSMREGGIERREKPESINSFVIDATSIRKTIESSLVANLVREILELLDYNP